ncbi:hypothetical protein BDN71DRAFT_1430814 [Pleurotus eryngii]|uniref:Uncharacterized protein n=1 Tax=Pleurotus eryngii TaxID=5323 RepID=A0A9P6A1J0_PLEER|nr:hypothetical protein BDN71DRAFT_1430814 [Pleurotus eryngii]
MSVAIDWMACTNVYEWGAHTYRIFVRRDFLFRRFNPFKTLLGYTAWLRTSSFNGPVFRRVYMSATRVYSRQLSCSYHHRPRAILAETRQLTLIVGKTELRLVIEPEPDWRYESMDNPIQRTNNRIPHRIYRKQRNVLAIVLSDCYFEHEYLPCGPVAAVSHCHLVGLTFRGKPPNNALVESPQSISHVPNLIQ